MKRLIAVAALGLFGIGCYQQQVQFYEDQICVTRTDKSGDKVDSACRDLVEPFPAWVDRTEDVTQSRP